MNTKRNVVLAVVTLIFVLPISLWLGSTRAAGQAPAVVNNENEGWSNLLEAQTNLWVHDLVPAGDGAALLVGEGHSEEGPFGYAVKIKADGKLDWQRKFADAPFYVGLATNDGGFLLSGMGVLARLDGNGKILWQRVYLADFEDVHHFNVMKETPDGGFVSAGSTGDGFILKLSSTGDVEWEQRWGSPGSSISDSFENIFFTADSHYLAVGRLNVYPWIVKVNLDGTLVWQKIITNPGSLSGIKVSAATGDGNIVISSYNNGKPWVAQLKEDGSLGWQQTIESANGTLQFEDMALLANGNLLFVGLSERFGEPFRIEGLALAMDQDGGLLWQRTYQAGKDIDLFNSVAIGSTGDTFTAGQSVYEEAGPTDAWVVNLPPDGQIARCPLVSSEQVTTQITSYSFVNGTATEKEVVGPVMESSISASELSLTSIGICPFPHLSIDKTGPKMASGGVPFTYSITVANNHDQPLSGVELRDRLPTGTSYVSGGELQGDEVVWKIGTLGPGEKVIEELTIRARSEVINEDYSVSCMEGYETVGAEAVVTEIINQVRLPVINSDYCPDFFDDFSNPESGWLIREYGNWLAHYINGEYELLLNKPDGLTIAAPACARWYYEVEADMRWQGQGDEGIGLMFDGSADLSSFSLLTLDTSRQEWTYWEITPGGQSSIGYASTAIHPGTAKNHLRVIRLRDEVQVEINGVKVDTIFTAVPRYKSLVGLSALANMSGSRARFDNFGYSWRPGN